MLGFLLRGGIVKCFSAFFFIPLSIICVADRGRVEATDKGFLDEFMHLPVVASSLRAGENENERTRSPRNNKW